MPGPPGGLKPAALPTGSRLPLLPLLLSTACVQEASPPFLGDCAEYPDAASWDFGEVGPGTCLASPTQLLWQADEEGRDALVVVNDNAWLDFTTGSVLALDRELLPVDGGRVTTDQAATGATPIASFAGLSAWVPERDLLVVPTRYSDRGRRTEEDDDVFLVDLSDPFRPRPALVAEDGSDTVTAGQDPLLAVHDAQAGRVVVVNTSSADLTFLDVYADPVAVTDAFPEAALTGARFYDADRSGSSVQVADLSITDGTLVPDDAWTISYVLGTFRTWTPTADGLVRSTSPDLFRWTPSGLGVDLSPEILETDLYTELLDPQLWEGLGGLQMAFADAGSNAIWAVSSDDPDIDGSDPLNVWGLQEEPLLEGREGAWDAKVGGPWPMLVEDQDFLFYDGVDADGVGGIGLATSSDGVNFSRVSDEGPLIAPGNGPHDALRAADPCVLYDPQVGLYRMVYGAWDGERWSVGHATSADLLEWEVDPEPLYAPAEGAAAPILLYANARYELLTVRPGEDGWDLALATSIDAVSWEDEGVVAHLPGPPPTTSDEPPGPAIQAAIQENWMLEGERSGPASDPFQAGNLLTTPYGFQVQLSAGAWLVPEEGPEEAAGGIVPGSEVPELDLVVLTFTDAEGVRRIGGARWNGGDPAFLDGVLLEGEPGAFDEDGVHDGVVYALPDGTWAMLYAGDGGGATRIGLATSADGLSWTTDHRVVFDLGDEDWESVSVVPGSVVSDGAGGYRLWYTGSDGVRSRIGLATSADGVTWTRAPADGDPWWLGTGAPGDFDDTEVAWPRVVRDEASGLEWMFYSGHDGATWRIGAATRSLDSDDPWERLLAPGLDVARVLVGGAAGSFDVAGAYAGVVTPDGDGWRMLYAGQDSPVARVGLAVGTALDRFFRAPRQPTVGDQVWFDSVRGDFEGKADTFPLVQDVAGYQTLGSGFTDALLDEERGMLFLSSESSAYIYVIDLRADEGVGVDPAPAFEALMFAEVNAGAIGFRALALTEDRSALLALNDNPESVMILDLDRLVDDDGADLLYEAVTGVLPAPRAGEADAGLDTRASVGPARMVQVGDLLYVANFNANTIGVYDLRMGVDGALVDEIPLVDGENPYAMAVSPDGRLLAVAARAGQPLGQTVSSTILLVDVDPNSPTWNQVVGWVSNL